MNKQSEVRVSRAPEPCEIKWHNLGIPKEEVISVSLATNFKIFVLMAIVIFITKIKVLKESLGDSHVIFVTYITGIFGAVLKKLSNEEHHLTKT